MIPNPICTGFIASSAVAALLVSAMDLRSARATEATMITMKNFDFSPMSLSVQAGTTVVWMNLDSEPHTVASDAGLFRSAGLDQNETFTFKFDKPGTYRFLCSIHPKMVGTIIVK